MSSLAYKHEDDSSSSDVELFEIAHKMKVAHLSDSFIAAAIKTALEYEGVADLLKLWRDEDDAEERNEIIADIQDLIEDCQQKEREELPRIKMNDLDAIAKDIRSFKDSLLEIANQQGSISHLAELTGIPQPSLSRFFNSNAMPRRTTLLKIAKALELDAVEINTPWEKMRKEKKIKYRGCEISYSVYGDNGQYSATAYITIHSRNHVVDQQIYSTQTYPTLEMAEEAIVSGTKQWVDNHFN